MNQQIKKISTPRHSILVLLMTLAGLALITNTFMVVGQSDSQPNITLYVDSDWLVFHVISPEPVFADGLQIGIVTDQGIQSPINIKNAFSQLIDTPAPPGTCYVYQIIEGSTILPSVCSANSLFKYLVPKVDAFWINPSTDLAYGAIAIYQNGNLITICPTQAPCSISLPPPIPPVEPVIPQGQDNTGNIQSAELDNILNQTNITAWKEAGWSGRGQKIGVIDRHFGGLDIFDPGNLITVSGDRTAYNDDNIRLGVSVLQVINAIAPDALLYACRYSDFNTFQSCVNWMIAKGVNIINHSASIPVVTLNGQNDWAQEVDRASAAGILWIDAAGDFEKAHLTEDFTDINSDGFHEFRRIAGYNQVLGFLPIRNTSGTVMLAWSDDSTRAANQIDLDLRIIDYATGDEITSSQRPQTGNPGDNALELVTFDMSQPFGIQVISRSGRTDTQFTLFVEFATLPQVPPDMSIVAPGDSAHALTVGALQGPLVAAYSSRGPVNGADKPDLVAPGEIRFPDGTEFIGSSAAAPIVAGFAALIWQARPDNSNQQIFEYIRYNSTVDDTVFKAGYDTVYGQGYLQAPALTPIPTLTPTPTLTATVEAGKIQPPTDTPIPTNTATLTVTPLVDSPAIAIVNISSVNLRHGPGANYDIAGYAYQGDNLPVIARAFDWYKVQSPASGDVWIAGSAVSIEPENAPINFAQDIPAPPPTLTPFNTPTFLPTPTEVPNELHDTDVPGSILATSTKRPPRPTEITTPVVDPTPNETLIAGMTATAAAYEALLTETATAMWQTLTYEAPTLFISQTAYFATENAPGATRKPSSISAVIQATSVPSLTPLPTATFTPTLTPSPSLTPSNTVLPTLVPTRTPAPALPTSTFTPSGPTPCVVSPPSGWKSYSVLAGDTVSYLSGVTNGNMDQIVQVNCLASASQIFVGQQLYLPNEVPAHPTLEPTVYIPPGVTPSNTPGPGETSPPPEPPTAEPVSISISVGNAGHVGDVGGQGCYATAFVTITGADGVTGDIYVWNESYPSKPGNKEVPGITFPRGNSSYQVTLGGQWPMYKRHIVTVKTTIGSAESGDVQCNNP